MKDTLLEYLFQEQTMFRIGLMCIAIIATTGLWKKYAAVLWIPTMIAASVPSLMVVVFTLAGGFGLFILPSYWPFPVSFALGLFVRPRLNGVSTWLGGALAFFLSIVVITADRPGGREYHFRAVDAHGRPFRRSAFSYTRFDKGSRASTGVLWSDIDGEFTATLYRNSRMTIGPGTKTQDLILSPIVDGDGGSKIAVTHGEVKETVDSGNKVPLEIAFVSGP